MDKTVLTRQSSLNKIKLLPIKLTDYTFHVRDNCSQVVSLNMTKFKLKRWRKEDEDIVGPGSKESTLARGGGSNF